MLTAAKGLADMCHQASRDLVLPKYNISVLFGAGFMLQGGDFTHGDGDLSDNHRCFPMGFFCDSVETVKVLHCSRLCFLHRKQVDSKLIAVW